MQMERAKIYYVKKEEIECSIIIIIKIQKW